MGKLGAMLKQGDKKKEEIGSWILSNIAMGGNFYAYRKNRTTLKNECDIRRHFRDFERDSFFFSDSRFISFSTWRYDEDMKFENGQWAQYYEKFGDKKHVKAIWDQNLKKVILSN